MPAMDEAPLRPFDRRALEAAFERIGQMAVASGKIVEISVYGGSALILTLNHRPATRDVDAVFEKDRIFIRHASEVLASEYGWPSDWLNDGVKGFLSRADTRPDAKSLFRTFPAGETIGLRVLIASPGYLFAMKCLSMRIGDAQHRGDVDDIRSLAAMLRLRTIEEAVDLVARYYPADILPAKTRFGLEEIFGGGET
jgi:hypothetical protein